MPIKPVYTAHEEASCIGGSNQKAYVFHKESGEVICTTFTKQDAENIAMAMNLAEHVLGARVVIII